MAHMELHLDMIVEQWLIGVYQIFLMMSPIKTNRLIFDLAKLIMDLFDLFLGSPEPINN